MLAIREVQLAELTQAPQRSAESSLARISGTQLPVESLCELGRLMAEVQATYKNESLPEGTPEMYMAMWERLTLRHGLERFQEALLRAVEGSRFFPMPQDIAIECEALETDAQISRDTRKYLASMGEAKRTWLREYLEDEAAGIERKPLTPEMRAAADALRLELQGQKAAA